MKLVSRKIACAVAAILPAAPVQAGETVEQGFGFGQGWTLSGNSLKTAIPVTVLFGSQDQPIAGVTDKVVTVWQWDGPNSRWMFFTPTKTVGESAAYAQSKGYGVLESLSPGGGFWVNAGSLVSPSGKQKGAPAYVSADDLPEGWSLNAVFAATTPSALNASSSFMPPQPGEKVESFVTLWAWAGDKWLFYAPSLDNNGTLAQYIADKQYVDFTAAGKKLEAGVGFWINRKGNLKDTPPEIFPLGLAVVSPTAIDATGAGKDSRYAVVTRQIGEIVNARSEMKQAFQPASLLAGAGMVECFGPTLDYEGHPDATTTMPPMSANGQLPSGDLGIWKETDGNGTACAAATLDRQMEGVSARTNTALLALAGLVREAFKAGKLPAAGTSSSLVSEMNALALPGATFGTATLALDGTGNTWSYRLGFSFADGGGSHDASLSLDHTTGSTAAKYNGVMQWSVTDRNNGGNCTTSTDVTRLGSLKYQRAGSTDMATVLRTGQFCNKLTSAEISAKYASDKQLDPASAWADNFTRFGAQYNPLTLDGHYGYGWQAGRMDSNVRMLAVGINGATRDGEAWFGYGDSIASSDGTIKGFYCNWAGPGATHTLRTDYAQRQFIRYNGSTGKWEAATGGSNIRYAPIEACTYAATGFKYDRNLDRVQNETSGELQVSGSEADFLYGKGSSGTIADAIRMRGAVFPAF